MELISKISLRWNIRNVFELLVKMKNDTKTKKNEVIFCLKLSRLDEMMKWFCCASLSGMGWSSSGGKYKKKVGAYNQEPAWIGLMRLIVFVVVGIKWRGRRLTASVLGTDAMTYSPLEVGLRVGLDKGVNGTDVSFGVSTATAVTSASGSHVLVITTNAQMLRL